jgi:hypothetical protein
MTRHLHLLGIASLVLLMAGCDLPEGDQTTPEGCYYQWLGAREEGDADQVWDQLSEHDQHALNEWFLAEQKTYRLIEQVYLEPSADNEKTRDALEEAQKALGQVDAIVKATALHSLDKKAALEAIDYGIRAKLSGAKDLLRHLMGQVTAEKLHFMQRAGAVVRDVEFSGTRATVTTWAGDSVEFQSSSSTTGYLWRLALGGEERRGLDAAVQQSKDNLSRVEGNVGFIHANRLAVP